MHTHTIRTACSSWVSEIAGGREDWRGVSVCDLCSVHVEAEPRWNQEAVIWEGCESRAPWSDLTVLALDPLSSLCRINPTPTLARWKLRGGKACVCWGGGGVRCSRMLLSLPPPPSSPPPPRKRCSSLWCNAGRLGGATWHRVCVCLGACAYVSECV